MPFRFFKYSRLFFIPLFLLEKEDDNPSNVTGPSFGYIYIILTGRNTSQDHGPENEASWRAVISTCMLLIGVIHSNNIIIAHLP